jgi:uncharacterized membrane protein
VSQRVGSWTFVITQTSILCVWLVLNSVLGSSAWDPQPFVLLNLCLSAQAAFTAPVRYLAGNWGLHITRDRNVKFSSWHFYFLHGICPFDCHT